MTAALFLVGPCLTSRRGRLAIACLILMTLPREKRPALRPKPRASTTSASGHLSRMSSNSADGSSADGGQLVGAPSLLRCWRPRQKAPAHGCSHDGGPPQGRLTLSGDAISFMQLLTHVSSCRVRAEPTGPEQAQIRPQIAPALEGYRLPAKRTYLSCGGPAGGGSQSARCPDSLAASHA